MEKLSNVFSIFRSAETAKDIDQHRNDILLLMPKTEIMIGFNQCNRAHQYDLWEHSLQTVVNLPKDIDDDMVFLAALIHDIGKPDCKIEEERDGEIIFHYYGHPKRSMEITRDEILPDLVAKGEVLSEDEQRRLLYYVEFHDDRVSLRIKHLRRHLRFGASFPEFQKLMKLQIAEAKAHIQIPIIRQRIEICTQLAGVYGEKLYQGILEEK